MSPSFLVKNVRITHRGVSLLEDLSQYLSLLVFVWSHNIEKNSPSQVDDLKIVTVILKWNIITDSYPPKFCILRGNHESKMK